MSDARVGERPTGADPGFERFLDGLIHSWTRTVAALGFTLYPIFGVLDYFTQPEHRDPALDASMPAHQGTERDVADVVARLGGEEPDLVQQLEELDQLVVLGAPADREDPHPVLEQHPGQAIGLVELAVDDLFLPPELGLADVEDQFVDRAPDRGERALRVLRGAARYYPEVDRAELERIDIIDIMSLSSWDRFLHPVSWEADIGVARKHPAVSDSLLLGRFNGGIGISHDFSRQTSAHAFAEGTVELSDRFDYFATPGVGPRIGLVHDFSERWRTGVSFLWQCFFLREWRNDYEAVIWNRFTISRQNIAGLDLEWKREFGNSFPGCHAASLANAAPGLISAGSGQKMGKQLSRIC